MLRAFGKKADKTVHAETCKKAGPRKYKCRGLYGELLQKHQEYQAARNAIYRTGNLEKINPYKDECTGFYGEALGRMKDLQKD
jgi:hypothetical protein